MFLLLTFSGVPSSLIVDNRLKNPLHEHFDILSGTCVVNFTTVATIFLKKGTGEKVEKENLFVSDISQDAQAHSLMP